MLIYLLVGIKYCLFDLFSLTNSQLDFIADQ